MTVVLADAVLGWIQVWSIHRLGYIFAGIADNFEYDFAYLL
jgi:hypothetical protein